MRDNSLLGKKKKNSESSVDIKIIICQSHSHWIGIKKMNSQWLSIKNYKPSKKNL